MSDLWLPGVKRAPGNDAGPYTGGEHKGCLHTTEGAKYAGALAAYKANNSWPHLTLTFEKGFTEVYQHIPLNKAARSLRHPAGTSPTNTDCVVQLELVGRAVEAPKWSRDYYDGIAVVMRSCEALFGIQRRCSVTFKPYPASYGPNNGVRLDRSHWHDYAGWLGHQNVPFNDHGDPGALDIDYLIDSHAPPVDPTWPNDFGGTPVHTSIIEIPLDGSGVGSAPICAEGKLLSYSQYAEHDKYGGDADTLICPSGPHLSGTTWRAAANGGAAWANGKAHALVTVAD